MRRYIVVMGGSGTGFSPVVMTVARRHRRPVFAAMRNIHAQCRTMMMMRDDTPQKHHTRSQKPE